jgi:hypothetical protein
MREYAPADVLRQGHGDAEQTRSAGKAYRLGKLVVVGHEGLAVGRVLVELDDLDRIHRVGLLEVGVVVKVVELHSVSPHG